jgi:hypothetical protein
VICVRVTAAYDDHLKSSWTGGSAPLLCQKNKICLNAVCIYDVILLTFVLAIVRLLGTFIRIGGGGVLKICTT